MEHAIKSILEEHEINDEKLAKALADIFQLFLEESKSNIEKEIMLENFSKGIR